MSENPTPTSEPATGPVVTAPPPSPPPVYEEPRRSKATVAAAWVGVAAGAVFIVAVVFFSGFILGAHSGGHRGHDGPKGDHGGFAVFRGGPPPPMFPMPPGGQFDRPGPGFGPGGPGGPGGPSGPGGPGSTTAPPRP